MPGVDGDEGVLGVDDEGGVVGVDGVLSSLRPEGRLPVPSGTEWVPLR